MADNKTKAEVEDKATSLVQTGWKFWTLMLTLVVILAGWHYRTDIKGWFKSDTTDITGGPPVGQGSFTTPKLPSTRVERLELSNDWSHKFAVNPNDVVIVDVAGGWHQYQYQNGVGRKWNSPVIEQGNEDRMPKAEYVHFRLKGSGVATVQIVPAP